MSHDIPGNYLWNLLKHDYSYAYVWLLILQIIPEGFHKKKSHDYCVISMKQIISMVIVLFPQKKIPDYPRGVTQKIPVYPMVLFPSSSTMFLPIRASNNASKRRYKKTKLTHPPTKKGSNGEENLVTSPS